MDSVGSGSGYAQAGPGGRTAARVALGNPAVRVALAAGTLLGVLGLLHAAGGGDDKVRTSCMLACTAPCACCWQCAKRAPEPHPRHAFCSAPQAGSAQLFQVQQIAAALVGFLCYKAAVVGVAIIPPPVDEQAGLLAQADAPSSGRADGSRD